MLFLITHSFYEVSVKSVMNVQNRMSKFIITIRTVKLRVETTA